MQLKLKEVSRLHFFYVAALAIQLIIFDAWNLLAPTAILQRWTAIGLFLGAVTMVWYLARTTRAANTYNRAAWLLILADISVATFAVYNQRGMAARAVALYAIPLVVTAILKSRAALWATVVVSMVSYFLAAQTYFVTHFNEGYKVELYGEVGFYCAIFVVITGLLAHLVNKKS